jgi:hypothetical protein
MENLNERAANYAAEQTNELLTKAIAQAYADGYRDGYKECAEDYDVDLYEDVDFIDLGLPSGLLWSSKYREDEEGNTIFLTYEEASDLDIPTEEQFDELITCCRWSLIWGQILRGGYAIKEPVGYRCEGLNGNYISFYRKGFKYSMNAGCDGEYFRIRDDENEDEKNVIHFIGYTDELPTFKVEKEDANYLMPIMLIKNI